jgi:hypothetical protein
MICPNCGSDDIFDSELSGDAPLRCNSCLHWFNPAELPREVVTVHDEAITVGQGIGAEGMPFFVNPAMFPKDVLDEYDEERREADERAFENVRDECLNVWFVTGEHLPDFTVLASTCENGCHTWIGIADTANDSGYSTPHAGIPTFLAQMQGLINERGEVNPPIARAMVLALQSSLN